MEKIDIDYLAPFERVWGCVVAARNYVWRKFCTNADRQRAYRERKKFLSNKQLNLTAVTDLDESNKQLNLTAVTDLDESNKQLNLRF